MSDSTPSTESSQRRPTWHGGKGYEHHSPEDVLPFLFKDQPLNRHILDQSCATHATGHSVHWIHTRQLEREEPVTAHIAKVDGRYISLEHAEGYETLWNHNETWLRALADVVEQEKDDAHLQYWPRYRTLRLCLRDRSVTLNLSERAGFHCAQAFTHRFEDTVDYQISKDFPCTLSDITECEYVESERALEDRVERHLRSWRKKFSNL